MTSQSLLAELAAIAPVREGELLSRHTTVGIGGPADLYMKLPTLDALVRVLQVAKDRGLAWFILGAGSNLLVGDRGIRGLVLEYDAKAVEGPALLPSGAARFCIEAGASFAGASRRLCREGFAGLEWAVGIPGTLGGAVVTNAGAHGGSLADNLVSVEVVEPGQSARALPAADFNLGYRESVFTRGEIGHVAVAAVTLDLTPGDRTAILARVAANDSHRAAAQPPGRNTGSMFRNPPGQDAWRLIDAVGLRGARCGGARITEKHTNFFENTGGARAADVKALIDLAARRVREQFGVELEPEVRLAGEGFEGDGVAVTEPALTPRPPLPMLGEGELGWPRRAGRTAEHSDDQVNQPGYRRHPSPSIGRGAGGEGRSGEAAP